MPVLVSTPIVRVVEREKRSSRMVMGMSPFTPPSTIFRTKEIHLDSVWYLLQSPKTPHRCISLVVPMAQGPEHRLYYMTPSVQLSFPCNQSDQRWLDRMARRLKRVKPETLWRRFQRERLQQVAQ